MIIAQTKPKPAGIKLSAVQFNGDPSVHPNIFHSTDPKPHWRFGGEDHGGPYDSGSSYLEEGTWIIGTGVNSFLVDSKTFERDWQIVSF